jgi:hypothetical protein
MGLVGYASEVEAAITLPAVVNSAEPIAAASLYIGIFLADD